MDSLIIVDRAVAEIGTVSRSLDAAFQALREMTTVDEVNKMRRVVKTAAQIACLKEAADEIRKQLLRLELTCLRKMVELGGKERLPTNLRHAVDLQEIDALVESDEYPSAYSIGSLLAFRQHKAREKQIKIEFSARVSGDFDVVEKASAAIYSTEPFTVKALVDEMEESIANPLPKALRHTLELALQRQLCTSVHRAVSLFGIDDLPAFVAFSNDSQAYRVPIFVCTLSELDLSIRARESNIADVKRSLNRVKAFRAAAIQRGFVGFDSRLMSDQDARRTIEQQKG